MSAHLIRDFIKATLKARGISAIDLSKMSGVNDSSIYDLLVKKQDRVDTGNVIKFANALGCTLDEMLGKKSSFDAESGIIPIDPEQAMKNLLVNLKIILKDKNINIKTLAELCNTDTSRLYTFHAGATKKLGIESIYDIATTLGYSMDQLIGRQTMPKEISSSPSLKGLSETDKKLVADIKANLAKAMTSKTETAQSVSTKSKIQIKR